MIMLLSVLWLPSETRMALLMDSPLQDMANEDLKARIWTGVLYAFALLTLPRASADLFTRSKPHSNGHTGASTF